MSDSAYSGQEASEKTLRDIRDNLPASPETGLNKEVTQLAIKADLDEIALDTDNLALIKAKTDNLDTALSTRASEATLVQVRDYLDTVETKLASIITNTTGLSLEATQIQVRDYLDTVETKLASIITNTTGLSTETTLALIKAKTDNLDVLLSTRLKPADTLTAVTTVGTITNVVHIDDNGGSVTVDGVFFQATQPISATSLPLPTNAAKETGGNLDLISASASVLDDWDESDRAKMNPIVGQAGIEAGAGVTTAKTTRVTLVSDQPAITVTGTVTTGGLTQTQLESELDEKFGDLGQKAMAGSAPIVLASDQSAIPVKLQDTAGNGITSTSIGGKQRLDVILSSSYAEDSPHTTADQGLFVMGVRNDARTSRTSTDGDYSPISVNQYGETIESDGVAASQFRSTALTSADQTVRTTPGELMGYNFINVNLVPVYVKFYNDIIANVTVGTTVPVKVIMVPAGTATSPGSVFFHSDKQSLLNFSIAISLACVTGLADNSTAAPTTAIYSEINHKANIL